MWQSGASSLLSLLASALLLLVLSASPVSSQSSFSFVYQGPTGNYLWSSIAQFLRPLNRPLPYVTAYNSSDSDNAWGVAPAGSFFLWGAQPVVSLSPNQGLAWTYLSGTSAGNSHIDKRDINPLFPGVYSEAAGNAGCGHRTNFNRFYLLGNVQPAPSIPSTFSAVNNASVKVWLNWATDDGQLWNQILSNGSQYAMAQQRQQTFYNGGVLNHFCVVDQQENVYDVSGFDTWYSNNLGVSFLKANSVSYFPARSAMSGSIYSPTSTTDVIVVVGGTSASGQLLNDVWQSSNGGLSWTSVTLNAPFAGRQEAVFAINSNGVMVVYGGDCGGGWCGVYGDAWVSVNGGTNWYLLNAAPGWNMTATAAAFDTYGYLWLVGGQTYNASSSTDYYWTAAVQRSSLSFSTSAITSWSSSFTGGQTFSVSTSTLASLSGGRPSQGGNWTAVNSSIAVVSSFSCALTTLPTNQGPFNLSYLNNGNNYGAMDVAVASVPAALVFAEPWSGTNATYDPTTGYWYGTSWMVAQPGSWVLFGTQQDVAVSTNAGQSWYWTAGVSGAGVGVAASDYDTALPAGTYALGVNNAQCFHRNTFNRFYVIGNNGQAGNVSALFQVWSSNDAQVWSMVADAATQSAMAAAYYTYQVQCVVGRNDVVYYLGGAGAWSSANLGVTFTPLTASSYFSGSRQSFSSAIYAPTSSYETIMVIGGQASSGSLLNDVWTTTNYGQSWTQVAATASFSPRSNPNVGVAANGVAILHGGVAAGPVWMSDVWASVNGGSSWVQLAASTGVPRAYSGVSFDTNGFFYINSGQGPNYGWNDGVYKSVYSINNIGQWAATVAPSLSIPAALQCTQGTLPTTFDFQVTAGSAPWGAIDQFVRTTTAPIVYVTGYGSDGKNQWAVAPAGSWVLWGTQPDISISTNNGASWTITSGTSDSNSHIDQRDIPAGFPTGSGNTGCAHRTTFNRFYLLGNSNNYVSGPYFNWATQDASIWYQVMDNATAYAMIPRANMTYAFCVVDQREYVYSVGGSDTWISTNLGVTFTAVASTAYFTGRTSMAGGIYSPTTSTDVIVVIGGNGAQDVWQSTNYAGTWTQVTNALPWSTRADMNFGIAQSGVFVMMGGDLGGGNAAEYNDVWVSLSYGASWQLLSSGGTAATSAPGLSLSAVAFDSAGFMYIIGGQAFQYSWTGGQYKSTLSFLNISTWAPQLSGNGASSFSVPSTFTPTAGAYSMGGNKNAIVSPTVAVSAYACGPATNVGGYNSSSPVFDIQVINSGDYWGNADVTIASTVQPIVYELPWTNSSIGVWEGNQWALAPTGSWLVWGSNPDVQLTTNGGASWTAIAGITGQPGLANTSMIDYDSGSAQSLEAWNAACAHRGTFNRFYDIGNNVFGTGANLGTTPTLTPFAGWASNDGLTWTQVMDNATSYAMAADQSTTGTATTPQYVSLGSCQVGLNDVVYYIGGFQAWQSSNLGVTFTPVNTTGGYLGQEDLGTRQGHSTVIYQSSPGVDTIMVFGGNGLYEGLANDVWSTTNYAQSWNLVALKAPWSPRQLAQVAVSQNGVIVLYGGMSYSTAWTWLADTWVSMNGGASWVLLNNQTSLGAVAFAGIIIDPFGYVVTSGGLQGSISNWIASVGKSTYSLNNIQSWLPQTNPGAVIPASLCPSSGTATNATFDMQPIAGSPGWGAIDQFIRVTNAPIVYVTGYGSDNSNQWAVAPAGSWFLWGTQPDVSLSTNNGATWTVVSGSSASNSHMDPRDINSQFPGSQVEASGNAGCSHRTTFNRFYLFGNNQGGSASNAPYFNWATQDGQIWLQVMDNATSYAMTSRQLMTGHLCEVDQQQNVYSVGGNDTWVSSNYGVTFTAVRSTSYFTPRTNFVGSIYSPTTSSDVLVVLGGSGVADLWQSSNGAVSWTQVTASLPWGARDDMNFQISQNGIFVMAGGDCGGGWCGAYNDVWASANLGLNWYELNSGTTAPPLSLAAIVFDSAGYVYLVAGQGWFYSWSSSTYKSTQSFLSISSWAPTLSGGQRFSAPSSSLVSGYWSQGGNQSLQASSIIPVSSVTCGPIAGLPTGTASINFQTFGPQTQLWGTADLAVQPTVEPITYPVYYGSDNALAWSVAPAGSWLLWGTQPDVVLTTSQGANWTFIAGISGAHLPNSSVYDYSNPTVGEIGNNALCASRTGYNRFYVIGNGGVTGAAFYAYASADGQTWTQVMDNSSSSAMGGMKDTVYMACVVDMNGNVYYIGGQSTWRSSNLGVTWTQISSSSSYFPGRTDAGAAIWAATATQELIIVVGGRNDTSTGPMNDVWTSTNYGASWTMQTAAASFSARQDANVAVAPNGVIVMQGGQFYNGTGWQWLSDVWVSFTMGASWYQVTGSSVALPPRGLAALTFDSAGYLHVFGGVTSNWGWLSDSWISTYSFNNIQTWGPATVPGMAIPSSFCPTAAPTVIASSSSSSSSSTGSNNAGSISVSSSSSSSSSSSGTPSVNPGTGSSSSSSSSSGLSGGAIAGIVIGSVVGAALLLVLLWFLLCGRMSEKKATSYETQQEQSHVTQSNAETGELHSNEESAAPSVEMQDMEA